jgi:hypothetical protein
VNPRILEWVGSAPLAGQLLVGYSEQSAEDFLAQPQPSRTGHAISGLEPVAAAPGVMCSMASTGSAASRT